MLPYVLAILGAVLLAGLGAVLFWDLRRQPRPTTDPALLVYLERLRLEGRERDRELWHALAELTRRSLPASASRGEVVLYDERRR